MFFALHSGTNHGQPAHRRVRLATTRRTSVMKALHAGRAAVAGALLAAGMATTAMAADTPIKFCLDFKFEGPAAPFLVAARQGLLQGRGPRRHHRHRRAGSLRADQPRRLRHLRHGLRRHQFADQVPRRESRRSPIKAVLMVYNKPPFAIVGRKSRGIDASRRTSKARSSARRRRTAPTRNGRSSCRRTASTPPR